jgi:preprotein translocase subunit SecA
MYEKLAGMTGTAVTEAEEFNKIYKLDVVVIPTHRTLIRKDHSDAIYKTGRAKLSAVADEIEKAYKNGQPVLVGTTSIDKNEIVSELLKRRGIKHEILNAKNHEREAEIIAKAGEKGAITVATNMAGRGVDIILGGDNPKDEKGMEKRGTKEWDAWEKKHKEVLDAGGLLVIGTERHESRRIDNQLRGRSGRQGDPGVSRFFVGLDDDIMRLFGGESISGIMTRFNMPEDIPLQHPIVSRAIEQAQIKVEGYNFDIRKHLVEYDDVLNKQREIIYQRRRKVLEAGEKGGESLKGEIEEKIEKSISETALMQSMQEFQDQEPVSAQLAEKFSTIIPFDETSLKQIESQLEQVHSVEEKTSFLTNIAKDVYKTREEQMGKELMRQVERFVMLSVVDNLWMDHLDAIENLRQGIGLRGYGQKDPLVEYKNEAYGMFEKLIDTIDDEIVHRIYKIQVQQAPVATVSHQHIHTQPAGLNQSQAPQQKTVGTDEKKKLGRNDPCWCGSGKKYKKCHYPN